MAKVKTLPNSASVTSFLRAITPSARQRDGLVLLELFKKATGEKPVMWGTSIVGFGKYHYKSTRSAQEGDWPLVGFSPRKRNLSLYVLYGNRRKYDGLLRKLGKHTTSVACLYINTLADVDLRVLERLVKSCYTNSRRKLSR